MDELLHLCPTNSPHCSPNWTIFKQISDIISFHSVHSVPSYVSLKDKGRFPPYQVAVQLSYLKLKYAVRKKKKNAVSVQTSPLSRTFYL